MWLQVQRNNNSQLKDKDATCIRCKHLPRHVDWVQWQLIWTFLQVWLCYCLCLCSPQGVPFICASVVGAPNHSRSREKVQTKPCWTIFPGYSTYSPCQSWTRGCRPHYLCWWKGRIEPSVPVQLLPWPVLLFFVRLRKTRHRKSQFGKVTRTSAYMAF